MVREVRRSSGRSRALARTSSGANARITLPLAVQWTGERVPSQLTLTTEVEPDACSTGTISSPSNTSRVTVSPSARASASHTGRATWRRSTSPRTELASCTSRRPRRYLEVRASRSTRPWRSRVASSRSAVERWTPSSRATSAPELQPSRASRSRIATALSTERMRVASRASESSPLLIAQHYTRGVDCCWALSICWAVRNSAQAPQPRRIGMSREEEIRAELFEHTLNGHAPEVKALTEEALALHMDPMDILFKALIPSLEEVGRRFEKGDFFVPEMLIAARAMQGALLILRPLIAETGAQPVGRYVIGTVKGDIHDIGKNLCVIMLEGAGFEVFDLGVNTPPEKFVEAVQKHQPDIVGFSAFLTTTMPMFKANIEALQKAGLRDKVHIAVGGAPVTEEYAKHVGADSYAPDASMATRMAKQLVGDRSGSSQGAQALEQAVMLIDETLRKG